MLYQPLCLRDLATDRLQDDSHHLVQVIGIPKELGMVAIGLQVLARRRAHYSTPYAKHDRNKDEDGR